MADLAFVVVGCLFLGAIVAFVYTVVVTTRARAFPPLRYVAVVACWAAVAALLADVLGTVR